MSESQSTQGDLGPQPEPQVEPGEPNPGGPDAAPSTAELNGLTEDGGRVARDLDPEDNPAVDEVLPEEMKEGEDTSTEATRGSGDSGSDDAPDPDEESPA